MKKVQLSLIVLALLCFSCRENSPATKIKPEQDPPIIQTTEEGNFNAQKEMLGHSVGSQAYIFGVPIMTMMYFRNRMHKMVADSKKEGSPVKLDLGKSKRLNFNKFIHVLSLNNHLMATAASPNADTHYSIAFFNLKEGPQVMTVPPIKDRYWSLNITDAYLANEPYICSRLGDVNGGTYLLTPPGWKGEVPKGMIHRKSPHDNFFALLRVYLKDPATDTKNVINIQKSFKIQPLDEYLRKTSTEKLSPIPMVPMHKGIAWFAQMVEFMKKNPPRGQQEFIWNLLRQVGVSKEKPFDPANLDEAIKKGLEKGLAAGKTIVQWRVETRPDVTSTKWFYSDELGEERNNYLERAEWATAGLICNSPKEAMYFNVYNDLQDRPLEGSKKYEIHIPADKLPPVDAFWSITSYTYERDFVPNDDFHYGVNSRNKNMKFNEDGSLTFKVQTDEPEEGRSNWIPTTESGRFRLNFRFYNPQEVMFDKEKVSDYLPPLKEVEYKN
jgi:hypothetical protein